MLDVSERQVDQETVAIVQPAEDECRNKGIEDGRMPYAVVNACLVKHCDSSVCVVTSKKTTDSLVILQCVVTAQLGRCASCESL